MRYTIEIDLLPEEEKLTDVELLPTVLSQANLQLDSTTVSIRRLKQSLDARARKIVYHTSFELVSESESSTEEPLEKSKLQFVSKDSKSILIIGAGPAGYFAALEALDQGLKPIVLERGYDVQTRRRDLRAIQQFSEVNPHSNYCFGEGGAGTYSDGKLYTRSLKRGTYEKILRLLVEHGANPRILYDTHPHIGSNKLPIIIQNIRKTIEEFGGEVHFQSYVTSFLLNNEEIIGVKLENGTEFIADAVILATGHSARDMYKLLHKQQVTIELKPFAIGVRAEHPQELIDEAQYRQKPRNPLLPASSYKLVTQVEGRGVFSFCMCPGGLIVPAATNPKEIVVNGMSMSRRDSPFANSGIVVAVNVEDIPNTEKYGIFAGLKLQEEIEQKLFQLSGNHLQRSASLRIPDFVKGTVSSSLPSTSYIPGIEPLPLDSVFPNFIRKRLKKAFSDFGKKIRGYDSEEGIVVGAETRTSSPIRIPRDPITLQHIQIRRLFPCGEGAGYAGGILSAAMDGQNCVRAFVSTIKN
jgi:uncharacterized FAD-dependent dehydrogenase